MNITFEALIYLWDGEDSAFDSVTTKAGFIECGHMMGGITKEDLWALAGPCRWVSHLAGWRIQDDHAGYGILLGWPKSSFWFFHTMLWKGSGLTDLSVGKGTSLSGSFAASTTLSSSGSSELPLHEDYGCVSLSLWTVADMPGIEGRLGCFWKGWKSFHSTENMAVRFEVRRENAHCFKRKAFFQICEKSEIIVTIPL